MTDLLATAHHCPQSNTKPSFHPEVFEEKRKEPTPSVETELRGRRGRGKMGYIPKEPTE